jgi:predicted ATPase
MICGTLAAKIYLYYQYDLDDACRRYWDAELPERSAQTHINARPIDRYANANLGVMGTH